MQITYVKDGKTEIFETRKGFDVIIDCALHNETDSWIGDGTNQYYTEAGRCDLLFGVTHFEVQ